MAARIARPLCSRRRSASCWARFALSFSITTITHRLIMIATITLGEIDHVTIATTLVRKRVSGVDLQHFVPIHC